MQDEIMGIAESLFPFDYSIAGDGNDLEAEVIEKRTIHPFASGIILRCEGDDYLVIASRDGIMRIKCLGISEIKKSTMLGQRLFTPESKLKEARMKNISAKELN